MSAAISTYRVSFRTTKRSEPSKGRVPRVTRLLALAHRTNRMIQAGELRDLADAARTLNLTRARVTQIMNLLLLAPDIQEAILGASISLWERRPISERSLRPIVAEPNWNTQRAMWLTLLEGKQCVEQSQ